MKQPDKKNYDFNSPFECLKYIKDVDIYLDNLEKETQHIKKKADKWDALDAQMTKYYCNENGEYDEENPEIKNANFCAIGEMAASAFGWV